MLGHIEGSIKSKGKVLIANGCKCKASVTAMEVAIEGYIEGNVEASERVEVKPKGRITGDIVAARMIVGDGAAIEGHVRIGIDATVDPTKAKSATEPKMATAETVKAR
jgi:cytoskeletal protein CcmA (bactofilin family)